MRDRNKTKGQLIQELVEARQRIVELETSGSGFKKAEEEKDELAEAVEITKEAVCLVSSHLIIKYSNNAMDELFGYKKGELIGKHISVLNAGPTPKEVARQIGDSIEKRGYWEGEIRNKRKDNAEFISYGKITAVRDKDGNILDFISTQHDITERKKVEEALQQSEERYRDLFENANDLIQSVDNNGKFVYVNRKWLEVLGYTEEEAKKLTLWDVLRKDQIQHCRKFFKKVCNGETVSDVETVFVSKDGKEIPVEGNANGVFKDRTFVATRGIFRDITERKKAEEELKNSELRLREQKLALEQKNIAFKEIVEHIEAEKNKIKDDVSVNVNELLLPIVRKLEINAASHRYLDLLEHHLEELTSSFGRKLTEKSLKLSSREIEICNMIKGGLRSKEISSLLNVSYLTIEKHRRNIRKKLGISNKDINLSSFLHRL